MNQTQIWHKSKESLLKSQHANQAYAIARDVSYNSGAKEYTWISDITNILHGAATPSESPRHLHELVLDTTLYPAFLYFDLDRNILPEQWYDIPPFDDILTTFLSVTQRFLQEVYNIAITLELGTNTHIGYAITFEKYSAHVVIKIKCANVKIVHQVAIDLVKYIYSNIHSSDEERYHLTFTKVSKLTSQSESIIDTQVYRNFGCFRMLYSSKFKDDAKPLLPYKESSKDSIDHLILCYPNVQIASTIPCINNSANFQVQADYSKIDSPIKLISIPKSNKPIPPYTIKPENQIIPLIPTAHLENIEKSLINHQELQHILNVPQLAFIYNGYFTPTIYHFCIDKRINHTCPYANPPRIHSNNRSYFQYNYSTRIITYRCFAEQCKDKCHIRNFANLSIDSLSRLTDMNSTNSLHCKDKIIRWNHVYNMPYMQPYPLHPLVVVRANMATGKTKILIEDYFPTHTAHPDTSVLVITYSRLLAKMYSKNLAHLGFNNYLDFEHVNYIPGTKVIVCLDSLGKLEQEQFDLVILDEVTSVLLHFNSRYMIDKSSFVCKDFKTILLEAQRIIMLDATADNTIVYEIVEFLAIHKQIRPFFIKNTYVRHTNRKAVLILNSRKSNEVALKSKAIDHVLDLLSKNKNVVVTSSTKKFIQQLEIEIQARFNNNKTNSKIVIAYHSGNTEDARDTDKWNIAHALLYSPSIAAGVSFENPHFHELVAFVDNSFYAPPVDTVLQQLFRVRQLIDGKMSIYVNDYISLDEHKYPDVPDTVDAYLEQDVYKHINKQFNFNSSESYRGMGKYDKNAFSYKILRGIIINRNKSLHGFTDILRNTLITDYNIPTTIIPLESDQDEIARALKLAKRIKDQKTKEYEDYSEELKISYDEFEEIESKRKRGEFITAREKQQQWIYTCVCELWGIQMNKVDQAFYKEYIGPPTETSMNTAYNKYFAITRYQRYLEYTIEDHKEMFTAKMAHIFSQDEHSIHLYKAKVKENYSMLIEGHKLLDAIFPQPVTNLTNEQFYKSAQDYFKNMSKEDYDKIVYLYDTEDTYSNRDKLKNCTTLTYLVKRIIEVTFNIQFETVGSKKKRSKEITSSFTHLVNKYNPACLATVIHPVDCIIDDDSYDPID